MPPSRAPVALDDDREELQAMDIALTYPKERASGVDLIEARIVRRSSSHVVARVVVEYTDIDSGLRRRATRALIVALHAVTGETLAVMRIRSNNLPLILDGLAEVGRFVETARSERA